MLREIFRRAGIVAVGTALGHGAILLATPWLARLYSPVEFGALALITSVSNISLSIGCLRYDLALPSANAREASSLFLLSIFCACIFSGAVFVVDLLIVSLGNDLSPPFQSPLLITLCVVFSGLSQAMLGWATRANAAGIIGIVRFGQGFVFVILAFIPAIGLLWSYALSFVFFLVVSIKVPFSRSPDDLSVCAVAKRHYRFPLISLPGAVLDVVGYSLCIWIISGFFGASGAGQFSQIQRLIGSPLMLVGMSLGLVLLRHTADIAREPEKLERLFWKLLWILGLLGVSVIFLTAIFGNSLLSWFLGNQWRVETMFITPVAIAVAVRACTSPLSNILITLRRFDLTIRWQVTYFISAIVVLGVAASQVSLDTFVLIYAVHECVHYCTYLFVIKTAIRSSCAVSSV